MDVDPENANPDDIDLELILQTFLAESLEQFACMEEALVALETRPEDPETLEALFRATHTLKGNSACMGFTSVADLAHAMEDVLQRLRKRTLPVTETLITLLLQTVDLLRRVTPEAAAGIGASDPAQQAFIKRLSEEAPAAMSPEEVASDLAAQENRKRPFGRGEEWIGGLS